MANKVKFKTDPIEEAKFIPRVIELLGEGIIAEPYRKRIIGTSGKKLTREIILIHEEQKKELKQKLNDTKLEWEKIESDYSKIFQKYTGNKPSLKKVCYISPTILGYADVNSGKKSFISSSLSQDHMNYVVPHELTHLFYRDVLQELNEPRGMISPLMESIDHLIIFKTPIYNLLNTSLKYEDIGFMKRNPEFMNKMVKIWSQKKDFRVFLEKAINLAEKTKGIQL